MLLDHLYKGGSIFMFPIYMLWITALFLMLRCSLRYRKENRIYRKIAVQVKQISFMGSFAFLLGVVAHIVALLDAFKAVGQLGNVSHRFLLEGLKTSLLAPFYGLLLFLLTLIFSAVVKKTSGDLKKVFRNKNSEEAA